MSPEFIKERRELEVDIMANIRVFEEKHGVIIYEFDIFRTNNIGDRPGTGQVMDVRADIRIP